MLSLRYGFAVISDWVVNLVIVMLREDGTYRDVTCVGKKDERIIKFRVYQHRRGGQRIN